MKFVLLACFVCLVTMCSFAEDISDAVMSARVETVLLLSEHLSPFDIITRSENGVVTISGSVDDEIQKDHAAELASSIKGVMTVHNEILVVPNTGSKTWQETLRQRVLDSAVSASVRTNLLYNREFGSFQIGVRTRKGIVTLRGNVPSENIRRRMAAVVFDTKGVLRVINELKIGTPIGTAALQTAGRFASDEYLERRVETAIMLSKHLMLRDLDVEVDDGKCLLEGEVDSDQQKQLATTIAASVVGIDKVLNLIKLRSDARGAVPPADSPKLELLEPMMD